MSDYKTNYYQTSHIGDIRVSPYSVSKYLPDELEQGHLKCETVKKTKRKYHLSSWVVKNFLGLKEEQI